MSTGVERPRALERHGIETDRVRWNLSPAALYEEAVRRKEGEIAAGGPLVCKTGQHTGRSPNDKFVVREPSSQAEIAWGKVNRPMEQAQFDLLHRDLVKSLTGKELFVLDCFACADPLYRLPVRVINEFAWHNLFCRNLFIDDHSAAEAGAPEFTIIDSPSFKADPKRYGVRTETVIACNFTKRLVLIGGTSYAGETKKSVFTVMNDRLPLNGIAPMHCSANVSEDGKDVAIFFGLSGTGKTTLSADPSRKLIGDDEHGWGDDGVFNFEGGCYAKTIRLSADAEPEIWKAVHSFGTVLENVTVDERGVLDLDDDSKTENTRAAYKLERIANMLPAKRAGHPSNVIFLTADAFGILPPIARLSREQALFFFLSGFTAKLAGTEIGVTEPQPTFSTCFGAPFLPQPPTVYAQLLGEKLDAHGATVWLINTGWTGGPFGEGHRMPIKATRGLLSAVLSGELHDVEFRSDRVFGFEVPVHAPGVDESLLDPRLTWADPARYDEKAQELARMFAENFAAKHADAPAEVAAAAPRG